MADHQEHRKTQGLRKRNRGLVLVACLALILALYFIGRPWVARKIETRIGELAAERGLAIGWQEMTVSLWGSVRLDRVAVRESGREGKPVAELDNIAVRFPPGQLIGLGGRRSEWRIKGATAVLHDSQGAVELKEVFLKGVARRGKFEVVEASARKDGLTAKVSGDVLLAPKTAKPKPFKLKLNAVRSTLTVLDIEKGGTFHVTGTFDVDLTRRPVIVWKTDLKGAGKTMVWKGVPLESAVAQGQLGSESSSIEVDAAGRSGSIRGKMTRQSWKESPLVFQGFLKDAAGREDAFNGSYLRPQLVVDRLSGPADLVSMAADIPRFAEKLPEKLKVRTFPNIELSGLRIETPVNRRIWSLESLRTDGSGSFVWLYEDEEVAISKVSGSAAYDGTDWNLNGVSVSLLGGTVEVDGRYREGALRKGRVQSSGIHVADLRRLVDKDEGRTGKGMIQLDYRGDLDVRERALQGSGTVRLNDAPTFDVPLLEEVSDLFQSVIPGMEPPKEGRFEASFTGHGRKIEVTRFQASGGTLNVSAKGTVDLAKERVDGRARGKLTGLPGVVTSPLSRLLEMEVSGPFEEIRVRPLGPARLASAAASGTVDDVVDFVEETGKATGTMIKEGVKAPFRFLKEKREEGKRGR